VSANIEDVDGQKSSAVPRWLPISSPEDFLARFCERNHIRKIVAVRLGAQGAFPGGKAT
jgi:hypothetical protein